MQRYVAIILMKFVFCCFKLESSVPFKMELKTSYALGIMCGVCIYAIPLVAHVFYKELGSAPSNKSF